MSGSHVTAMRSGPVRHGITEAAIPEHREVRVWPAHPVLRQIPELAISSVAIPGRGTCRQPAASPGPVETLLANCLVLVLNVRGRIA